MQNRIFLFLFLCILGGISYSRAESGKLSKKAYKSYEKVCRQLTQEGWAVYDKKQLVEEAMMQYYLQMETCADSVLHVIGRGQDRNVNRAYSQAKHRVSVAQASRGEASIKVITEMIMTLSSERITNSSLMHSEQLVRFQDPVVSLYRKNGERYEVQLLYLIKY